MASDPFAPQHKRAARELRRIYRACKEQGGATSWAIVRDQLNLTTGIRINRGTLSGVARGKRPATPQIFRALGMPVPHYKPAPACPECGKVHYRSLRSCPDNKKPRKPGVSYRRALYFAAELVIQFRNELNGAALPELQDVQAQMNIFILMSKIEAEEKAEAANHASH